MRLLVNTLSIGSLSGRHVVYGFLRPFVRWASQAGHEIVLLHYAGSSPPSDMLIDGVSTEVLSNGLRNWAKRTAWEIIGLPRVVRRHGADLVWTVSGSITPGCPVPQVSLAQNPWCYVPRAHRGWRDRVKAKLQRSGYRRAYREAAMMIYISNHLRDLYRRGNPGCSETTSAVAYVGLDDDTYRAAEALREAPRRPLSILGVSAWAAWKGAHSVIRALRNLHDAGLPATLQLVGPWPDPRYEQSVRRLIAELRLDQAVTIAGQVDRDCLHHHYATSQVYCLMSCCESFGIPAAEAQAFGTPVVSSHECAIAEICAGGGLFGPSADVPWVTQALTELLTNPAAWEKYSAQGRRNAARLTWEQCAEPLKQIPKLATARS